MTCEEAQRRLRSRKSPTVFPAARLSPTVPTPHSITSRTHTHSWPAISWGTLEYGTAGRGNIVGGRWKQAHYALATLFADTILACGADGRCYVRHDGPLTGVAGTVTASLLHTLTGAASPLPLNAAVSLPAGVAQIEWLCVAGGNVAAGCGPLAPALAAAGCGASGNDCVLSVSLTAPSGTVIASNSLLLTTPGALVLPPAVVVSTVVANAKNHVGSINVTVSTTATALYVTLTTEAAGRFADNAIHVWGARTGLVVPFHPFEESGKVDPATLSASLRVEHLGAYLGGRRRHQTDRFDSV